MNFAKPLPLTDILARLDAKTPIGSALRTKEWEMMPQELRDSAFFSASVTEVQFLAAQQKAIREMIDRAKAVNEEGESFWKMDRARFLRDLRVLGESIGIPHPTGRVDGDGIARIKEADITDPLSIARLKLVVNTQLEMAYSEGQYRTGLDPDILNEWPALELVRISPRRVPRDWETRWTEAGGTLHEGRMIALKTSPIWRAISRFNKPHPPFDFNSGMGVEEIDRDTAEALGLISQGERIVADTAALQTPREASLANVPKILREALQQVFGKQLKIDGDVVSWKRSTTRARTPAITEDAPPPVPRAAAKPAAPRETLVQKRDAAGAAFAKEFGCKVEFKAPDRKWGAMMHERDAVKHLETVGNEWRRMLAAFPKLALKPPHVFLCVESGRGLAHLDGPAPYMSTKTKEWSDASRANIEAWEQKNGRKWGTERKGHQVADNFRHELAHTLSTPVVMEEMRRIMIEFPKSWFRQNVSEYARESTAESLAELFSVCTREDYVRGTYPPRLENFIFKTILEED